MRGQTQLGRDGAQGSHRQGTLRGTLVLAVCWDGRAGPTPDTPRPPRHPTQDRTLFGAQSYLRPPPGKREAGCLPAAMPPE